MARDRPYGGGALEVRALQGTSVGELLRQPDEAPSAVPSKNHRPPRTPNAGAGAVVGRPPSGRRQPVAAEGGGRAASPARGAEMDKPRILGAFRAARPRSQSRGRSPSCGPSDDGASRARASSAGRCGRDIIAENRVAAVQRPRASSAGRAPPKEILFARNGGNVPLYLQKVKDAIAAEGHLVAHQMGLDRDPNVPPGHRLLSEDERQEILSGLQKQKLDLTAKHSRLPLHADTYAQKQRATELEKALQRVELDIIRFSQPRILLKL